jgi:RHS repeat-associated protein
MNVTTWVLSGGTGPYTRYEYDPYGLPRQLDAGTWNRTSSADVSKTETLYCGYRYDPETGLYQVRERYYHPTLGRWGQWDRLHYLAGLDLLAYAGSCPSSHVDPSGLEEEIPESKVDPAYRSPDSNDLDYFDTPCDAVDNIKYKQSGMIVKRLLRYRLRTDFPRYGRVTAVTSITGIEGGAFHRAVQERIEEQQHSPGAPGAEWNARMLMAEWAEQEGLAPVETSIEITAADDVVVLRKIEAVIDAYWLCECAVAAAPATKPAGATASKPAAGWSADSPPNSGYSIALGSTFYEGKTLTDQRGDVQSGRTEERDNQYWVWRRVQYQNTPHIRLGVARRKALEEKLRVAGFNKPLPPGWIASTEVDTHDIDETTYKDIIATVQKGDPGTNVWIVVGK